ncbi:TPA: AAA family ATPase [Candidatus Falkowbacteria bacterium]|nr:AAA family ATPase [Candidatus Falkowbacteria bacterium]HAY12832.1 AAA family ATPase [Candidatus Falkowbacteria bacterium]HBI97594.1 AAA family ATPase [Candidatus Falkowbacteria bacterium]HBT27056.1 AAA family ATPase [Candidatus Falkowbacteria bacterium]HBY15350.1 AAA family ATPase [Candidatus Falkowbacteria bacterium]
MDNEKQKNPLADRMRPLTLDDFVGQEAIVGKNSLLYKAITEDRLPSIIFWGPPGSGKTTLAQIIANISNSRFIQISAVTSGLKDLRHVVSEARANLIEDKRTILFIDEIHRWNKKQQDALLPHVEKGLIILIGATTENPSFEVRGALLSRCRVFVLKRLDDKDLETIITRALKAENGLSKLELQIEKEVISLIAKMSNGDARTALNTLEYAASMGKIITRDIVKEAFQKSFLLYDKDGEEHYNIISALHKSMRGSDADAALYWLARMLEAGEDPLYIARRIVRFASEDIGLANSRALEQAVAAYQACHFIGAPECNVILAQAVVYMSKCAKSNSLYTAYKKVQQDIADQGNLPVPLHLRNAPTGLMKNLGYGKDYKYSPDHGYKEKQEYLPEKILGRKYL